MSNTSNQLRFRSDSLIEHLATTNGATGDFIIAGTHEARVFHDKKDTSVSASSVGGTLVIPVNETQSWEVGDTLYVMRTTNVWYDAGLVVAVDHEVGTIEGTNSLPETIPAGYPVAALIAGPLAMAAFGTPAADSVEWGWRATLPDTTDLLPGMSVRIEYDMDAGAGLRLIDHLRARVTGGK